MTYATAQALRMALEQRLLSQSNGFSDEGASPRRISLDRLRRRVIFERILARLQAAEPGLWVLKGGMALEVRLREAARLSKDLDLGLRADVHDAEELRERLVEAVGADPDNDRFVLTAGPVKRLTEDGDGRLTWRVRVAAELAGRLFGAIHLDVSPRSHELDATDFVQLPNSLSFAGIDTPMIEIIDIHRHAAEKLHGMLRDVGDRENTRVRDLIDLVILSEHGLLDPQAVGTATRRVWTERDRTSPPPLLPPLPASWPSRYEHLAGEHGLSITSFSAAVAVVAALWAESAPIEET